MGQCASGGHNRQRNGSDLDGNGSTATELGPNGSARSAHQAHRTLAYQHQPDHYDIHPGPPYLDFVPIWCLLPICLCCLSGFVLPSLLLCYLSRVSRVFPVFRCLSSVSPPSDLSYPILRSVGPELIRGDTSAVAGRPPIMPLRRPLRVT